jgi:hypothetical protein
MPVSEDDVWSCCGHELTSWQKHVHAAVHHAFLTLLAGCMYCRSTEWQNFFDVLQYEIENFHSEHWHIRVSVRPYCNRKRVLQYEIVPTDSKAHSLPC